MTGSLPRYINSNNTAVLHKLHHGNLLNSHAPALGTPTLTKRSCKYCDLHAPCILGRPCGICPEGEDLERALKCTIQRHPATVAGRKLEALGPTTLSKAPGFTHPACHERKNVLKSAYVKGFVPIPLACERGLGRWLLMDGHRALKEGERPIVTPQCLQMLLARTDWPHWLR